MRGLVSAKLVAAALLGLLSAGAWLVAERARGDSSSTGVPFPAVSVVVELFSSEGCSSCPPADDYLARLDRTQPIPGVSVIALEENVDYWDRLGWRDPFARAEHGARQRQYAAVLSDPRVYTPEVVIDGHSVMESGDEDQARHLMQDSSRESKARIVLAQSGSRVTIDVSDVPRATPDDPDDVWIAITESDLSTRVERGENAGRYLVHAPVVRRLRSLGRMLAPTFHAETTLENDPSWKPHALRTVVFVQLEKSRHIVGAKALSAP
jgi:hypothetical protein